MLISLLVYVVQIIIIYQQKIYVQEEQIFLILIYVKDYLMNLKNVNYVQKVIDLHQMVIVVYHKFKIVLNMVLQIQIVSPIHVLNA